MSDTRVVLPFRQRSDRDVNPQTALRLYAVMKMPSFRRLAPLDLKGHIFITAGQRPAESTQTAPDLKGHIFITAGLRPAGQSTNTNYCLKGSTETQTCGTKHELHNF